MRIAVDIELFFRNRAGVGRYVEGILGGLTRLETGDDYTLFRSRTYANEEGVPNLERAHVVEKVLPASHRVLRLEWLLTARPRVEKQVGEHDLFFSPGMPAFPTSGRLVVVMHDMVWMKFPHFYPRRSIWTLRIDFRRVVRRCAGILTDSEASRRDILEATGFDERRVRVVYLGLEEKFRRIPTEEEISTTLARLGVRRPYVLSVAGDNSRKKNLGTLVRAMTKLPPGLSDVTLVNVGRPQYDAGDLEALIAGLNMGGRVRSTGRVTDDELRALYGGASLTAYPSLYEGFGFPIVESMGLGTPVVTSNVSSMPEVAGDAALLVDPHSVDELSKAIGSLLSDPSLRETLRRRGLERVERFRWERSARETREFFMEMVHG